MKKKYQTHHIVVDVEADGPAPGPYSMVCFGAVYLDAGLENTFYGKCFPISDVWLPDALSISGISREEHLTFPDPKTTMTEFAIWLDAVAPGRRVFWADNNGFDWSFINYYFHVYYGSNPFGFSSQNINSLYKGAEKDLFKSFKHLRVTKHTHNPVDDAKGNAEAMLAMNKMYHLGFPV